MKRERSQQAPGRAPTTRRPDLRSPTDPGEAIERRRRSEQPVARATLGFPRESLAVLLVALLVSAAASSSTPEAPEKPQAHARTDVIQSTAFRGDNRQLRLRALGLPQPPPPPTSESRAGAGRQKRRSLPAEPNELGSPNAVELPAPGESAPHEPSAASRRRSHLMASTWQEAKRVLLLSATSSAIAGLRATSGRPAESATTTTTTQTPTTRLARRSHGGDLPASAQTADLRTTTTTTTTTAAATPADKWLRAGDESAAYRRADELEPRAAAGEIRRQRHNSQQLASSAPPEQQPDASGAHDSRVREMAAAMLPFVWPSFQLAASARQLRPASSTEPASTSGWPMEYKQVSRAPSSQSPTAASDLAPSVVSVDPPPTSTSPPPPTTTQPPAAASRNHDPKAPAGTATQRRGTGQADGERSARKRRRKPTYLLAANSSSGALGSAPTYPDSTRLASRYQMPRIKFQGSARPPGGQQATTAAPLTTVTMSISEKSAAARLGERERAADKWRPLNQVVPKSLSKLIEQQLLANATNILADWNRRLRDNQTQVAVAAANSVLAAAVSRPQLADLFLGSAAKSHLAPTTSVSKVVRLRNETDLQIVISQAKLTRAPTTTLAPLPRVTEPPAATTTVAPPTSRPSQQVAVTTTTTEVPPTTTRRRPHTSETLAAAKTTEASAWTQTLDAPATGGGATSTSAPASTSAATELQVAALGGARGEPTTSVAPLPSGATPKKFGQQQLSPKKLKSTGAGKNIKLFHFKRKPDMNKLPFYKNPLNYTALGWTSEQIQEHLESLGLSALELAGEQSDAGSATAGEPESDESAAPLEPKGADGNSLLRRKRRGKNQFERLMAELHGEQPAASGEEHLVPVLRKRDEPLVLKPMFSVMNQKKRRAPNGAGAVSGPLMGDAATTTTTTTPAPSATGASITGAGNGTAKPIIRMRRKHHGEQPLPLDVASAASHWRPSKPAQSSLMLVPSGLLTPSGSHLMPLYAPAHQQRAPTSADEQSRFVNDFWRPSARATPTQPSGWRDVGAMASAPTHQPLEHQASDERPAAVAPAESPERQAKEAASGAANSTTLRVPKLLVKPMRPAKYSLNGYIPKPSLAQQLQAQQLQSAASPLLMGPQATPSAGSGQNQSLSSARQTLLRAKQRTVAASNGQSSASPWPLVGSGDRPTSAAATPSASRDLDSSTTNEIFSRRRGLQQHLRSSPVKSQLSFVGLLASGHAAGTNGTGSLPALSQSAVQRQMDENKRKYVQQQQDALRPPTLSAQRVNQIKAKLGLLTGGPNPPARQASAPQQVTAAQASTRSISTADPSAEDDPLAKQFGLIGAPLNSIPKTDFECTDKRGKFVSGLFADTKTGCQVWHLCSNNRKYSFLCPTGTIFNAKVRICDWRYNVKCENTPKA